MRVIKALLQIYFQTSGIKVARQPVFNLPQNWCRSLQAVLFSPKDKAHFKKCFKVFLCSYHTFLGGLVFISWCDLVRMKINV